MRESGVISFSGGLELEPVCLHDYAWEMAEIRRLCCQKGSVWYHDLSGHIPFPLEWLRITEYDVRGRGGISLKCTHPDFFWMLWLAPLKTIKSVVTHIKSLWRPWGGVSLIYKRKIKRDKICIYKGEFLSLWKSGPFIT